MASFKASALKAKAEAERKKSAAVGQASEQNEKP
jgi:hypothetical protein